MNPALARALRMMGYRRVAAPARTLRRMGCGRVKEESSWVWMKPVARVCFVVRESDQEWRNVFVNCQGEITTWNSASLLEEKGGYTFLMQLKDLETHTGTKVSVPSRFEFLTPEESALDVLDDL